ncbi:universal stress protein [Nocardioides sp.]|uniref:universal stress protein n=1 Tax=Nocardioides sp. TaxID=35761 RepID=UPI003D0C553C
MLNTDPHNVMVCVSPGEDCEAALEYAVAQARSRGCRIHLVSALPPFWGGPTGSVDLRVVDGTFRRYGTEFLIECEEKIHKLSEGTVDVSTRIIHEAVVPGLVAESENAALVVTQHHRMHRKQHLPALSITNGVAARAHAPVVAIPDDWHESAAHPDVIAVGVEDAVSSRQVVKAAFEEARRLGADLNVVRAWFFSAAFDGDVFAGEAGRAQNAAVKEEVIRDFAPIADDYPDVSWRAVVVHGRAPDVLVAESELVRLLVVGRHDPVTPLGSHLGPVTRPVLNHSTCPVLVIDPRA